MKTYLVIIILLLNGCSVIPELHVIGVYEGINVKNNVKHEQPKGKTVIVNISITNKSIVLALSSYAKTKWIIKAEKTVDIEKIILSGYHSQSVIGVPNTIPIEVYTYDNSPCLHCYQGNSYFYSYKSPPSSKLKKITGLEITSWQGKYRGREFSIFPNMKTLKH